MRDLGRCPNRIRRSAALASCARSQRKQGSASEMLADLNVCLRFHVAGMFSDVWHTTYIHLIKHA